MKILMKKTGLMCALLATTAGVAAQDVERGTDDLGVDFYQQNDFYTSALNKPQSTTGFYERQVNWMLENQYPPASIIMSSVSRGMTLADTAFFMSKAQPERAEEIYDLAVDIMPVLPGWACSADSGMPNRYDRGITPDDVPSAPTLNQLASLYFDEGKRFMEYPQWEQNQGHADIAVDELIAFKQKEIDEAGVDSWWYRPDDRVKTDVVSVSLYPTGRRVVIDSRIEELEKLKSKGVSKLPVMLLYTEERQIPMSDFNRDSQGDTGDTQYVNYEDDEISATEVISRFDSTRERVSPTRDWHQGDHHLNVQVDELNSLFDIPSKEDIAPEDWQRWEKQLEDGQGKPLLISLYEGAGDDRWMDEKGMVAVAAEKEIERLPVVFFYHSNQRQVCGLPAACTTQLKEAIIKGSGRDDLPFDGGGDSGGPGGNGGNVPVVPPPGVGPVSPN